MNGNLPLFDPRPAAPEVLDIPVECLAGKHPDVRRLIESKHGTFRELGPDGHLTGREFRLAELHDGRIVRLFADGAREKSPVSVTSVLIDDALRQGSYVEVEG